jgi:outer membrane receptor for ferrienterochelin and colicins
VALGGGSFGSLEGDFLVSGKLGDAVNITAGAHYQKSDRAPLDEYYRDDFPKVNARTFGGVIKVPASQREDYVGDISSQSQYVRLDAGDRLTLGFYRNRFRNLSSNGDRLGSPVLTAAFWDTTIDTWHGKYRFNITTNLSSETVVDFSRYEVDPSSRYVNVFTDFENHGYDYAYGRRAGIEQNLNWQASDAHSLQAGIGYRNFHAIETPDLPRPYRRSQDPDEQGMTYYNTSLPLQIFEARYHSWSGYLQWQAQWTPPVDRRRPAPRLVLDLWRQHQSAPGSGLAAVGRQLPETALRRILPCPIAGRELQRLRQLQCVLGNPTGVFRAPNENLEPEKSKTWSATWDWRPGRKFNLVTNAYLTEVERVIITRADASPIQYIPGTTLTATESKQNSGSDRYHGIDIIPQWQMHLGGPWSADLWGSYSYVKGWYRETDDGPN